VRVLVVLSQQRLTKSDTDADPRCSTAIAPELHSIVSAATYQVIQSTARAANDLRAFSRLPPELVCATLRRLALDELMVATHVCQSWRQTAMGSPALWSYISGNLRPTLLALVLERSQDAPIDVLELHGINEDDPRLNTFLQHMYHIRTFALRFSSQVTPIRPGSPAHNILSSQAPALRRLSILSNPLAQFALPLDTIGTPFGGIAPLLESVQLMAISRMPPFIASLPEAGRNRIHTLTLGGYRCSFSYQRAESLFSLVPSLRTLNVELWEWTNKPELGEPQPVPSTLQQLNIRATDPHGFFPQKMLPNRAGWERIPRVHISYLRATRFDDLDEPAVLPRNGTHIVGLEVRTQVSPELMHVRATHADGRVRMYCGIHPDRAAGLLDNDAAANIETLIVSAATHTATMICELQWPSLKTLRLIADGSASGIREFTRTLARSEVRFDGLQRIEHASPRQWDPSLGIDTVNELLRKASRPGGAVPEVHFVGVESHGSTQREPASGGESDAAWFRQPPFQWT